MTLDDCDELRGVLAGLIDAIDPASQPDAHSAASLALDALIDPTSPPAPWRYRPVGDVARGMAAARALVDAALNDARPAQDALAMAEASRQLARAQRIVSGHAREGGQE